MAEENKWRPPGDDEDDEEEVDETVNNFPPEIRDCDLQHIQGLQDR